MILVSEHIDESTKIPMKFYFGIDFDRVLSHPSDGSDGLMFCFLKTLRKNVRNIKENQRLITYYMTIILIIQTILITIT